MGMMGMFRSVLKGSERDTAIPEHTAERNIVYVQCRECIEVPVIFSAVCVRCICGRIGTVGEVGRIVLRSGVDVEYSGDVVRTLCSLSRLLGTLNIHSTVEHRSKKCIICRCAPSKIIRELSESFPIIDINEHIDVLSTFEPSDDGCVDCISSTYDILDQIDYMERMIRRTAASSAYGISEATE